MDRFATIDIGSNTVLVLVAEAGPDGVFEPVLEKAEITRLGRGVDAHGLLSDEAVGDTVAAVAGFADEARALGARDIACVATSAARDAKNGAAFLERLRTVAGVEPEVLDGATEATLSYESARRDFGAGGPLAVLDIGGGSTELAFGVGGDVSFLMSFDVGSVRLTERIVRGDPPTFTERRELERHLEQAFAGVPAAPAGFRMVGIAGTVTTIFSVARWIEPFDAARVHGQTMSLDEVRDVCERLLSIPLPERRRLPGMVPKRADVLPVGAVILERVMSLLGARELTVSDRGVRWGLLYRRFGGLCAPIP